MWVLRRDRRSDQVLYSSLGSGLVVAGMAAVTALALATTELFTDHGDDTESPVAALSTADPSVTAGGRQVQAANAPHLLNPGVVLSSLPLETATVPAEQQSDEPSITADDDLDPSGTLADWYPDDTTTYRTVCVRMCDGAMTPMSFATTKDRFALDALRCKKSCGSASMLYVQKNPAPDPDALVSLDGKAYSALPTAYRFRTSYDEACTCRPHAWQQQMQARHRMFAIKERIATARKLVRERIAVLRDRTLKGSALAVTSGHNESNHDVADAGSEKVLAERAKATRVRRASAQRAPVGSALTDRHDVQASSARFGRRYNGLDWRISVLEPL